MTDTPQKLTTLLVDDEFMMRQMLKLIAEETGLSIAGAAPVMEPLGKIISVGTN